MRKLILHSNDIKRLRLLRSQWDYYILSVGRERLSTKFNSYILTFRPLPKKNNSPIVQRILRNLLIDVRGCMQYWPEEYLILNIHNPSLDSYKHSTENAERGAYGKRWVRYQSNPKSNPVRTDSETIARHERARILSGQFRGNTNSINRWKKSMNYKIFIKELEFEDALNPWAAPYRYHIACIVARGTCNTWSKMFTKRFQ